MTRPLRIVLIGPTSAAYETIAAEVEPDLERLARAGVELEYRCTGAGPASIRSEEDVAAAAPHVVRAVAAAARDGFDAAIIDCADDPGLDAARAAVSIAVVGPGEAVRAAVAGAPHPVALLTGDITATAPACASVPGHDRTGRVRLGQRRGEVQHVSL